MLIYGRPSAFGIEMLGNRKNANEYWNLTPDELTQKAIENSECDLSPNGAILVKTGKFTGRSANDKYIVNYDGERDGQIDWGKTNQPLTPEKAKSILEEIKSYLSEKDIYIQDLLAGNHPKHHRSFRVITETSWHSLFAVNLLLEGDPSSQTPPDYTLIHVPGFFADQIKYGLNSGTFIILDFERNLVLIGGTAYAGEVKKAIFTIMNRVLPDQGILPMHCSANIGNNGDSALFFGLSGTGKTTLSSDPDRRLIGDDEHGWCNDGVFNFEGGCYAKTIGLKQKYEPLIWDACQRKGSVLENVIFDQDTKEIDFEDATITENTRAAYPLEYIDNFEKSGRGDHPKNVFFLSADAFGVLPPISLLDINQSMYYFLSGFTAKLAGTELGLGKEPQATFSSCFGAPFLPLKPQVYAELLGEKLRTHKTNVWLINTGWTGGSFGVGSRMALPYTRALIRAALDGSLLSGKMEKSEVFNLSIPEVCAGVPTELLNPVLSWKNKADYYPKAQMLLDLFEKNYKCISV